MEHSKRQQEKKKKKKNNRTTTVTYKQQRHTFPAMQCTKLKINRFIDKKLAFECSYLNYFVLVTHNLEYYYPLQSQFDRHDKVFCVYLPWVLSNGVQVNMNDREETKRERERMMKITARFVWNAQLSSIPNYDWFHVNWTDIRGHHGCLQSDAEFSIVVFISDYFFSFSQCFILNSILFDLCLRCG